MFLKYEAFSHNTEGKKKSKDKFRGEQDINDSLFIMQNKYQYLYPKNDHSKIL